MRPEYLTVEGLTCFKERQEIDFGPLELFAISGPTGAGKSTLLDAILFALYGAVPRVGRQQLKEMISASRDRVSVRLDFSVGEARYRVTRSLRRSGSASVRLEQHDGNDFTINLADQVRAASEQITQILGLDANAFMQAVMLPQGEFARFLKAAPADRRRMLSALLRLEVYERMREQSQRIVMERKSALESTRRLLEEEYGGMDEAALERLQKQHAALTERLTELRKQRGEAETTLASLRSLHDKSRELRTLEARQTELARQAAEVAQARARLEAARRAAPLVMLINEATRAAAAAKDAEQAAAAARKAKDEAEKESRQRSEALRLAEQAAAEIPQLRERVARLQQILGRLPELRQLETASKQQLAERQAVEQELADLAAQATAARTAQQQKAAALDQLHRNLEEIHYDATLHTLIERVRDDAAALANLRRSVSDVEANLNSRRQLLKQQTQRLEGLQAKSAKALAESEAARTAELTAREALHQAHRLDAASHLREGLKPGDACPVCEQRVRELPPVTQRPEVNAAEQQLKEAMKSLGKAEARARQAETELAREQAAVDAAHRQLTELEAQCAAQQKDAARLEGSIREALGRVAPTDGQLLETWVSQQVAAMAKSREAHESTQKLVAEAERARDRAHTDETAARERIRGKEELKQRLQQEHERMETRLTELRQEIAAVSQSKDPAGEAQTLDSKIKELEARRQAAADAASEARAKSQAAETAVSLQQQRATACREETEQRDRARDAAIGQAGFPDAAAVRAALLDETAATELSDRVERHARESHTVAERAATLRQDLGDVRVSDEQLADQEQVVDRLNSEVDACHGESHRLQEQIERLQERLERSRQLREEQAAAEQELNRFTKLASDLRSDKFQAYVLQEAFTELVQGASSRLRELTNERYALQFTDDQILVVDYDNAGETRISDTLSGGETFLTSLALALELSNQVQRAAGAVRLDSLFIDEGFGTLDPETLAVVAETIQTLQVGGRMVGIITHIPELRDEFRQRILVFKENGSSRVEVRLHE